jgi:hypothetical protein
LSGGISSGFDVTKEIVFSIDVTRITEWIIAGVPFEFNHELNTISKTTTLW